MSFHQPHYDKTFYYPIDLAEIFINFPPNKTQFANSFYLINNYGFFKDFSLGGEISSDVRLVANYLEYLADKANLEKEPILQKKQDYLIAGFLDTFDYFIDLDQATYKNNSITKDLIVQEILFLINNPKHKFVDIDLFFNYYFGDLTNQQQEILKKDLAIIQQMKYFADFTEHSIALVPYYEEFFAILNSNFDTPLAQKFYKDIISIAQYLTVEKNERSSNIQHFLNHIYINQFFLKN
jgi:hypothetical protein